MSLDLFEDENAASPIFTEASTFVALPSNDCYLGDAPTLEIGRQVARAKGPSGPNVEYVALMAAALEKMGVNDEHIKGVLAAVRQVNENPV